MPFMDGVYVPQKALTDEEIVRAYIEYATRFYPALEAVPMQGTALAAFSRLVAEKERAERERDEARRQIDSLIHSVANARTEANDAVHHRTALTGRLRSVCEALEAGYYAMDAVKRHGELAVVQIPSIFPPGGKKPPSKEVFEFPRHLLREFDAALATIRAALDAAKKEMEE